MSDKVIAAIEKLSQRPIQFIANTSFLPDRTGGNAKLSAAGMDPSLPGSFFVNSAPRAVTGLFADPNRHATIMAHNNVTNRMQDAKISDDAVPGDTYLEERRRKSHNGDSIEMFYEPNAVTDGDSIVFFRRADVIVAGNIVDLTRYPMIDPKNGGSIEGEIKALNDILNRTNYEHEGEGGTYVVPGHGFLADEHEVVEYRDMVVIVRDAGAGESGEADGRLRHALRVKHRAVDDGHVRGSCVQQPEARSENELASVGADLKVGPYVHTTLLKVGLRFIPRCGRDRSETPR
jgi:hypothetical protein